MSSTVPCIGLKKNTSDQPPWSIESENAFVSATAATELFSYSVVRPGLIFTASSDCCLADCSKCNAVSVCRVRH